MDSHSKLDSRSMVSTSQGIEGAMRLAKQAEERENEEQDDEDVAFK